MSDTAHTLPDSDNPRQGITLNGIYFRTKAAAERHIRAILSRYDDMEPLAPKDRDFVMALLDLHPHKETIIDCGIRFVVVQYLDTHGVQRRFCVLRTDSSRGDFTWRHALYPRDARQTVMRVCRSAVRQQIEAFKHRFFNSTRSPCCALSGRPLTYENSDVDHIEPDTFEQLVDRWCRSVRITWSDVGVVPSAEYETPSRFEDVFLAQSWAEFHIRHANMRVIHREAHQSLPKGRRCANAAK